MREGYVEERTPEETDRHYWVNPGDETSCARCGYSLGFMVGDLVTADVYAEGVSCEVVEA